MQNPQRQNESQFFSKLSEAPCVNVSDTIKTRLNNGRKCLDILQCMSRKCNENNVCEGLALGESCSDHQQCEADLSCRVQSIWPYATTCQPRGEVRSMCESDYDCKSRNFCWQLNSAEDKICIEKHNAPYGTQFFWDSTLYPLVNKESILFHGQYCQSGFAMRRSSNVSECVDITNVTLSTSPSSNLLYPFPCTPNGQTRCNYRTKTGETVFSLPCECSLSKNKDVDLGYCPLPPKNLTRDYIDKIKKVWY